jgi:antitoxin ParD1/3/4
MAKVIRLSLPDYLDAFVDAEIAGRGPLTRAEFVEQLVLSAWQKKHHAQLEKLLQQGINSGPATPMTKESWADLRRRVQDGLEADKKRKRKRA